MDNLSASLEELKPNSEFFIGIDSDGCVFDTMEIKHKKCFCPEFVNHFDLHTVSKYAIETWEFVNLYSRSRGTNRFSGLLLTFELLANRNEGVLSDFKIPDLKSIKNWVEVEKKLGNPALKKAKEDSGDRNLSRLYDWSVDVNKSIFNTVNNVPPFSFVRESLEKISGKADAIVISSANQESLNKEWSENNLDKYVRYIAGQESGNKKDCYRQAVGNKYSPLKTLMVGDAPGDLAAARKNNALFYPIIAGSEESSWKLFYNEGLDRFFNGTFAGEYEEMLIEKFFTNLPEKPVWQQKLQE